MIEGMLVHPSPDQKPPDPRLSIRTDARLDAATRKKVDELAQHFHRPRAAVLCQIMHWGLNREHTEPVDQGEFQVPVRHFHLYVPSKLHEQGAKAATAAGVKTAPWLRHLVRQIAIIDFPASWQDTTPHGRSHDSRTSTTRFMLRLDQPSQAKLEELIKRFNASKAEIIRHLIAQATPDDFPKSWQMSAAERHGPRVP